MKLLYYMPSWLLFPLYRLIMWLFWKLAGRIEKEGARARLMPVLRKSFRGAIEHELAAGRELEDVEALRERVEQDPAVVHLKEICGMTTDELLKVLESEVKWAKERRK